MTGLLSPVALFHLGTIHVYAIGQAGPSIWSRHVHVYRNGKLVVKWDLDNKKPMMGAASRKLLDLIRDLESEGRL
jgi:hypothetical protein